jgi:excisionase family DNA binding protein
MMDRLLTYQELAELLHLSIRYIAKLVNLGQIPFVKIGRSVRFNPIQISLWLEGRSNAAS